MRVWTKQWSFIHASIPICFFFNISIWACMQIIYWPLLWHAVDDIDHMQWYSILKHFLTPNRRDPNRGPQLRERQGCEREPQTRPDERALEVHRELLLQLWPGPPCRRLQLWQDPRVLPACHKRQLWGHRIRRRGQEIYLGAPRQQIGQFSTASSGLCLRQKQPRTDPS